MVLICLNVWARGQGNALWKLRMPAQTAWSVIFRRIDGSLTVIHVVWHPFILLCLANVRLYQGLSRSNTFLSLTRSRWAFANKDCLKPRWIKKNKKKINGTVPQICTHDIYRMYMLVLNRLFFFFQFWLSLNVQTCSNQYFCISDGLYDSAYRGRCHSWWQTRRDGAAGRCFQCNRSDTNLLHTAHKEGNKEERLAEGSHFRLKSGEDVRKGSVKGQFSWSASVILANATGGQYEVRGEVS